MNNFYVAMRQCYRKARFVEEKTARKKANKIIAEGGPRLYPYGCTQCGGYHLTKNQDANGKVF
jgi:hypothetical protein